MEYNKDEGIKCLKIANDYLCRGDKEKALKFAKKAEQLYPSTQAKCLLEKINRLGGAPSPQSKDQSNLSNGNTSFESSNYTQEQVDAVSRIKGCKDFYEILGIDKDADENEIKRRYRKLALQFHPDKNHAPGAADAFKAIGNAFSILSDSEKRRKYNLTEWTTKPLYRRQHTQWDYSHGFESDRTAEEIFNMFFGDSAHFTNVRTANRSNAETAHTFRRHHHVHTGNWSQLLLQLSPVFVLVILSIVSMSFVEENPYSLTRSSKYPQQRESENIHVTYFVSRDFSEKHSVSAIKRIEKEMEQAYLNHLRKECMMEKSQKENLKWKAQLNNNGKAYEAAEHMEMSNCHLLENIDNR